MALLDPADTDRTVNFLLDQLQKNNPVFVLLSLDPVMVQHHSTLARDPIHTPFLKTETTQLFNFAGVVVGYNMERASEDKAYWEVLVPRMGSNNNILRVKMVMTGADLGRISRKMVYLA